LPWERVEQMAETGQVESRALQKTAGSGMSAAAGGPAGKAMAIL